MKDMIDIQVDFYKKLAKLNAEQKRNPEPTLSEKIANSRVKRSMPLNNPFDCLDKLQMENIND